MMKFITRLCSIVVCWSTVAAPADAQTSYPMLMSLQPAAAQVGTSSELTVQSRYSMSGAWQVIVSGEGVSGEVVTPELKEGDRDKPLQKINIRFTVDPSATPGLRDFRLIGPFGASTVGQLAVVQDPVVVESKDNNTADQALPVELPATLCGTIEKAEDVDFYKFHAGANETLVFHVYAMRMQDRIHDLQQHVDPILTIRDASGNTIAVSDNVFAADPLLVHQFAREGDYWLEVRDVRYQGNTYWEYCVEVSSRRFLMTAHPLAVTAGSNQNVQLVGPQGDLQRIDVEPPASVEPGRWTIRDPLGAGQSNPLALHVSDLPIVVEQQDSPVEMEQSLSFVPPATVCGRIETERDVDGFVFEAKKGDSFSFDLLASRLQSNLDAHLRILDAQGKQLALADDMRIGKRSNSDSRLDTWTAPADGRYLVEIRDLHLRGGAAFPYALCVDHARPEFQLFLDTDKTLLTSGTAGVLFVRAERINGFDRAIQLSVEGLPEGVTAHCGRILPGKAQDGCIIFQADVDAVPTAANLRILGRPIAAENAEAAEADAEPPVVEAMTYQEIYQPGGGRGHWPVEMHTLTVGQISDLRGVRLSRHEVVLKPGESQRIDVFIDRNTGFDKNVTLDVQFRHLSGLYGDPLPPGVSLDTKNSKVLLTGQESAGHITLQASKDAAPVSLQQISVMAHVSLNFVMKATYSSGPLRVSVEHE